MPGLDRFLLELRRRRVFRVVIVYAAVAFIVWQAAEIAVPALNLPDWVLTFVVLVTVLGAPIAFVLGWAFDITPEGVRRTEPSEEGLAVRWRVPGWLRRVEVLVFGVAAVLLLIWSPWKRPDTLVAAADLSFVDSLAVLPIENRTDDPRLDNLAAGVTDQIVSKLKRVGTLKVIDSYSVEQLDGFTPRQLADSLHVDKLILGRLFSTTDGVSLSMRLLDGRSGSVLNTWDYEGDPSGEFEAAVKLADAFVGEYLDDARIRVAAAEEGPSPQGPGYENYLVGKTSLGRRTSEGIARARAAFSEALAENPGYAFAYAGLSRVYTLADVYRYRTDASGYQTAGLALAFADRAIELEPNLAYAYSARLLLARRSAAPPEEVAADCERTMELEPANAEGLAWCAQTLIQTGNVEVGFQAAEQGVALNPQNAGVRMALAYVALALGRHERAAEEARMSWQLEPGLMLPRALEGWARLLAGQPERCIGIDLGPFEVVRATCLHALGRTDEADVIVDSVAGLVNGTFRDSVFTDVVHLEALAVHYAWLGDAVQSLAWLRRAYEVSPTGVETRVLQSDLFDRVKEDPEFAREVELIQSDIWRKVKAAGRIAYQGYVTRSETDLPSLTGTTGGRGEHPRKTIVVLPFENLGPAGDEYFADGITDEITSRLASVRGLSVISRTSAVRYKNTDKSVRQIGLELGVEYVLEGTVRWEHTEHGPSRVFVTPQLIRVSDDSHIWADRYDRVLAGVVAVQSDIAERVVRALGITLVEGEQESLSAERTEDLNAYDLYLRGNEYFNRGWSSKDNAMMAAQMYEEAVRLDPAFAAAWARLSMVYSEIYFAAFADPRDPYLDKAKEAVDKAMAIDADMPEAHIALGLYYYRGFKDYDHALAEFESARLIQPNNADLWESTAYVQRRRGEWEEAVASLKMAIELDPLGSHKYAGLLTTLIPMRRYDEARTYVDRYVSLWPDDGDPYQKRISLYLMSTGDTDVIRRVLVDASTNADSEELQANWVQLYVIERDYRSALGLLSIEPDSVGYYLEKAKIYGLMNRPELRRAYSDSARTLLEAKIESDPDEHALFSQLGLALAGLDRKREAIRAGERAVELVPMSADTYRGTTVLLSLAEIYAQTGEVDAAIDKLEFLLSVPSYISVALLRVDPAWDPLREHPRFEELLGKSQ